MWITVTTARARHRVALGALMAGLVLRAIAMAALWPSAAVTQSDSAAITMDAAIAQCPALADAADACRRVFKATLSDLSKSRTPRFDALLSVWGESKYQRRRLVEWDDFELAQVRGLAADYNASRAFIRECAQARESARACLADSVHGIARGGDCGDGRLELMLDALDVNDAARALQDAGAPRCAAISNLMTGRAQTATLESNGLARRLHRGVPKLPRVAFSQHDCFFASRGEWSKYFANARLSADVHADIAARSAGEWRCAATVLLMGAQKASSTELRAWLVRHPLVRTVAPWRSEPHVLTPLNNYAFPAAAFLAQALLSPGDVTRGMRLLDKTPGYFHLPGMAPKVAGIFTGSLRLVVLLRDPAERLVSGLWNVCFFRKARCAADQIEAAAALGATRDAWLAQSAVEQVRIGHYSRHLATFVDALRTRNDAALFVGFADHFKRDPVESLRRIEAFLALPPADYAAVDLADGLRSVDGNGTLRFNRLHVDGYRRPARALVDALRAQHYAQSLAELAAMLSPLRAQSNRGLKLIVEEWPAWLQAATTNASSG